MLDVFKMLCNCLTASPPIYFPLSLQANEGFVILTLEKISQPWGECIYNLKYISIKDIQWAQQHMHH